MLGLTNRVRICPPLLAMIHLINSRINASNSSKKYKINASNVDYSKDFKRMPLVKLQS
jgi:hypothetical protein